MTPPRLTARLVRACLATALLTATTLAGCDGAREPDAKSDDRAKDQAEFEPAAGADADKKKSPPVTEAVPVFGDDLAFNDKTVDAPTFAFEANQPPQDGTPANAAAQFFTDYGVNPTIDTRANPVSTFGIDVDTAAYATARSYLERGSLPPTAGVRVEEVVNYFDYHYVPPKDDAFSLQAEVVPSPNREGFSVLHLGLKGKEIAPEARPDANLVFVIDVSGSMDGAGRLGLVKQSLGLLVQSLRPTDRVAVVVYGSDARVVLPSTPGDRHETIMAAVDRLATEGSTNVEAGLRLGYSIAAAQATGAHESRVILCSDGVANTGSTTADALLDDVADHASRGITITTVGVGMGDYNDTLMEQLADRGNGNYAYVDDLSEARRVFVDNLSGTLVTIAKDVKLQVEFDPAAVARYRLLGYENRGLSREDFDDDRKDAGELGAGHTVTALYEVRLTPEHTGSLGTVRIRYKAPRSDRSELIERPLPQSLVRDSWEASAPPTRLSVVAAAYAEKLRGSYWVRNLSWAQIEGLYDQIDPELRQTPQVQELGRLIKTAAGLDHRPDRFEAALPVARMDFDRVPVLR